MEVGISKETVEMFEERVGQWQTNLMLRVLLWGIIAWALTPLAIGAFVVASRTHGFGLGHWGDIRALLLAVGLLISLMAGGAAGVIVILAIIAKRRAVTATVEMLEQEVKVLEERASLSEKHVQVTNERAATLRTITTWIRKEQERMATFSEHVIQIADALEEQEAIEPDRAERMRQSARNMAKIFASDQQ